LDDSHPDIQQTIKNIQQTAKEADIPVGQLASSTDEAKELIDDDVQIIRISGGEIAALRSVVETRFDKLTEYTTDK
jgi:2-keto-3-deoxy-L-rhamnonate aldolase RhmA